MRESVSVEAIPQSPDGSPIGLLAGALEMSRADLAHLEARFLGAGVPTRADMEALFRLDRAPTLKCAQWTSFFVEAITDYVVWQVRPTGVLGDEIAEWLIDEADFDNTVNALAVLVNVLAEAERVPRWFLRELKARAAAGWPGIDAAIDAVNREQRVDAWGPERRLPPVQDCGASDRDL